MCLVDLPTGRVSLRTTDFDIPGLIPLAMKRHYRSTNIWLGDLGHGWGHPFQTVLYSEGDGLMLRGADGRRVPFARPAPGKPSVQPTELSTIYFVPAAQLPSAALKSELRAGAFAYQRGVEPTLFFDATPRDKIHPWRAIADRFGNVAMVTPGAGGLPARIDDPEGRTFLFERNKGGLLTEIRIAETAKPASSLLLVRYLYDQNKDLIAAQDPAGTRTYRYENHRLILHQDRCGMAIEASYDAEGRCVRTSGPNRVLERTNTYEPEKNSTSVRDSLGNVSVARYSDDKVVVETIDNAGGVSKFDYDGMGRLVQATNQMGFTTSILYGLAGGQVGKVNPCGAIMVFEKDANGEIAAVTTTSGAVYSYTRDELGRVVAMTRPGFGSYEIGYDEKGRMSSMKLPGGRMAAFRWSPDGRTLAESDEGGLLSEQKFDLLGRLVERRDARGGMTSYRYSDAGYLAEIVNPDGGATRFGYDAEGRVLEARGGGGGVARWKYDGAGRCVEMTLPSGQTIRSEYDTENRMTGVQGPDDLWHRYVYDGRGLVTRQEFSDGRVEQYGYDPRGVLARFVDPAGQEIQVETDEAARIRTIRFPDGTQKTRDYDPAGQWMRVEWDGHLLERDVTPEGFAPVETQDDYTLHREYDDAGRLLSVVDSLGRKVAYTWDECDRVVEIQVTPGAWVTEDAGKQEDEPDEEEGEGTREQEAEEEAREVEQQWVATGTSRSHRFKYDRTGNVLEWESSGGVVEQRHYDAMNRMTVQAIRVKGNAVVTRQYTYDEGGRVRSLFDSRRGERQFAYDAMGRLLSVKEGNRVIRSLSYSKEGDLQGDGLQYAKGHRVRRVGGVSLEYDRRGFIVKRSDPYTTDLFDYTTHGLLKEARIGTRARITYEHDPFSRLVRRRNGAGTSRFYWNGDQVWAMRDEAGRLFEWLYVPKSFVPLEQADGSTVHSIHTDHLGRPLEMIDGSGNLVWSNNDGLYGEGRTAGAGPAPRPACPLGFPGQIRDADTGFCDNRFRTYYPESAHYLTPDPIGIWGGLDAYRYSFDPVNVADPYGLKCAGKENEPTLYRGDKRPPKEICGKGFSPKNPAAGLTLAQHVEGCPSAGSNWISTAHQADKAEAFGDYIYVIDNPGCGKEVDCDPDVQKKYGDPVETEAEIAFNKPIPSANVLGWYPKGAPENFTPC